MNTANQELLEMQKILEHDVMKCSAKLTEKNPKENSDNQFWRRTYVRAVFALIEGVIFRMKDAAIENAGSLGVHFSRAEVALLIEEDYELNDKGEVKIRPAYLQLVNPVCRFSVCNKFCEA